MKQIFALLLAIALVACIFWQDRIKIAEETDEKVATLIEYCQDDLKEHNIFDDLKSEKYFKNGIFFFADYAKDLGYYEITFPKNEDTILIFRRGEKKIIVKKDGTINFSIYGDQFEDGIDVKLFAEKNDCYVSFGEGYCAQKTSKENVIQIATAMIHLRENDTLMEMALDNRQDEEKIMKDPKTLKGFF